MDYLQYDYPGIQQDTDLKVLNLIINGLPSIFFSSCFISSICFSVLNLIINGLPSI